MLEDNYNTNIQTVQLKIADYMKLSKEDRQKHIDLTTDCQFYYYKRDWGKNKIGDLYNVTEQTRQAKKNLLEFLDIEDFGGREIHVCHVCDCNSYTDKVCVNKFHLYFGTKSENELDKPLEIRQKIASKGGKKAAENMTEKQKLERSSKAGKIGGKKAAELGKTCFQQKTTCPYCSKEGALMNMKRWHFDNCKFKIIS